ncbi:MAG: histidinol-phosphate transaminase [Acidimicrobiales bacterium]|jgi:histidinol-phosphate aminotransferase|nr:histidinol-phosphate transaminase [Acidimicrobiales bacterium]HJM28297.1 histidinol-phosphate transaminase [Acidimicrobiales bacterium]
MTWPKVRDEVALLAGYHSPQMQVDVRLNTNESPYPPPEKWIEDLEKEISEIGWNRYPDREASQLVESIASYHNVVSGNVVAANGSNEILQSLYLAYGGANRSVGIFEPTYALHSHIARITGTSIISAERNPSFIIDQETAEAVIAQKPNLIFLCSPNNPTGIVDSKELINYVMEECSKMGTLLVVDEAYSEFSDWSAVRLVNDDAPIVVSKTFSKTWSMASARLGYLVGPERIVKALKEILLPYHLDAFKQIAGRLALEHVDEMNSRVKLLSSERERVAEALQQLPVKQWESGANFILFKPVEKVGISGQKLWELLLERSILVRNCSSWPRLENCLRVTIGTLEENNMFLNALKGILE